MTKLKRFIYYVFKHISKKPFFLLPALFLSSYVIGAGAGLSTAAGFTYTGERFAKYFSDFAAKYGIQDMYSGGIFPVCHAGGALGVLEPIHLHQPLYG